MSYAAENHSIKLLHSFYDAVVRYKLKSNLVGFSDCVGCIKICMKCMTNIWGSIQKNVEYTRHIVFKLRIRVKKYPLSISYIGRFFIAIINQ